jgi:CBS-domain-containing membrane protein
VIVHLTRDEVADLRVADITIEGKTAQTGETAGEARRVLSSDAVKLLPVLAGARYVGAVDRETLNGSDDRAPLGSLARPLAPVESETTRAGEALAALDAHGGTRLVVVDEQARYVGLVCLRGNRSRLCIDAARLGL